MTVIPPFNIKTNHYNRTSHDVWQMMTKELSNTGPLTLLYGWLDYIVLLTQVPFNKISKNWHCSNVNVVQTAQRIFDYVHVNLHVCRNYNELQWYLLKIVSIYSTASLSLNQSSLNVMESEEDSEKNTRGHRTNLPRSAQKSPQKSEKSPRKFA